MPQSRRLTALTIVAALLIGAVTVWGGEDSTELVAASAPPNTAPPATGSSTTIAPDFTALVASGAVHRDAKTEADLTDEALTRSTSTTTTVPATTTTTTTTPADSGNGSATPTTTSGATTTSAPTTTSPPTTQPPSTTTSSTTAGGYHSGAESEFASRINSFRSSNGSPSLSRDGSLDSHARSSAKRMAEKGEISHSNIGSLLPPWSAAGENVGTGDSVGAIFDALVSSSGHRSNMLEDYTHMGIGVYKDASGRLWTAHVFAR